MKKILFLVISLILVSLNAISLKPKSAISDPKSTEINRVFEDLQNEYTLAKYFMNGTQRKNCKKFQDEERSLYILRFWKSLDPNPVTEKNEFLDEIRARIVYADEELRGVRHGWKSDMGRIYVRYGAPYDIEEYRISSNAFANDADYIRYANRKFEIWKYRGERDETFIFFELQTYGDLRMIYSESDSEVSFVNWRRYFGDMDLDFLR